MKLKNEEQVLFKMFVLMGFTLGAIHKLRDDASGEVRERLENLYSILNDNIDEIIGSK